MIVEGTIKTTIRFNDNKTRRYSLIKEWNPELQRALYILKNPTSYTDGFITDPTINLCVNKVQVEYEGRFGSVEIVNLYSICKDKARELNSSDRQLEDENISTISQAMENANWILVGWGLSSKDAECAREFGVLDMLKSWKEQDPDREIKCFHDGQGNYPQHPAYQVGIRTPIHNFPIHRRDV